MTRVIHPLPLTPAAFAPFGDVIEATGTPDRIINAGRCARHHDLAALDATDGRLGLSLFDAQIRTLPLVLDLMERHPAGSQAFLPMAHVPFLVVVAPDDGGRPGTPRAFLTVAGQGVNYHRDTWHGVLTPLHAPGLFAVIDRIGPEGDPTDNLEEHHFETPWTIATPGPVPDREEGQT